jgi:Fur family peroxide stress response transcriptional regulator
MEKKRNYSKKREAILKVLRGTTVHPSAEWIYTKLKPEYPDLSLGTVYRNLAQFKEEGSILSVGTVNGQERFDGNTNPHSHFVCSECGAVLDIPGEFVGAQAKEEVARRYSLTVESSEVLFRGVCDKCLQRRKPL